MQTIKKRESVPKDKKRDELNYIVNRKHAHKQLLKKYKKPMNLPYFKDVSTVVNLEHISKGSTGTQAHVFRYYIHDVTPPMYIVTKIIVIDDSTRRKEIDVLKSETKFYKLANYMVNKGVCPFFLRSIPRLTTETGTTTVKSKQLLNLMGQSEMTNLEAHVLTTETYDASRVKPLFDFLDMNILSDDEVDIMIFQFAYAFSCMNKIGWRHNDLHFDNVMALRIPPQTRHRRLFEVIVNSKSLKFLIPYTQVDVRIFDFDLSVKVEAPNEGSKKMSCLSAAVQRGKQKEFKALQKLKITDTYYNFNPCYDFVSAMCELKKFYPHHRFFSEAAGAFDCVRSKKFARTTHHTKAEALPAVFFPANVLSSRYFERFRYTATRVPTNTEVFSQAPLHCR